MQKDCFSHLAEREQLGHIASEVARARGWAQKANVSRRDGAAQRAVEIIDCVLAGSLPLTLVSRDELVSWKARLESLSADEGLLVDVETRLMKILTAHAA